MSGAAKILDGIVSGVKTAATKTADTARSVAKTTPGKITLAGAAVGGGSYLAMSGVTAGAERVADGISYTLDTTGATDVIGIVVPDFKEKSTKEGTQTGNDQITSSTGGAAKGVGSILVVVGIVILAYFIIKNMKKTRRG